ncbi:MAG: paraquat-inducible protein A [Oleispira sp.]
MSEINSKTACHECDLLLELPDDVKRGSLLCPRCGFVITKVFPNSAQQIIALSLTALVLLIMANAFPFLTFEVNGQFQEITLLQSVTELWSQGYPSLAMMILIFILIAPACFIFGLLYLLLPLYFYRRPPAMVKVACGLFRLTNWSMVEVFLIGVLVSLIKIASMATVIPGISFWAYILFSIAITFVLSKTDQHQLWLWLEQGHCHDQ